jgi:3-oxoadipate enol-lactonase
MTAAEVERVEVDGVGIAWQEIGPADAPPLVLVHSLGLDAHMWEPQVEGLSNDHFLVVMDLRGHGRSDAPAGPYSLERLGRDVLAVADAAGLDRFSICGLSIGGLVAQWLALERPERLSALVLANTAARIGTEASWSERIAAVEAGGLEPLALDLLERWFSTGFEAREPGRYTYAHERLLTTSSIGYSGCCAALAGSDLRERVGAIDVPTLVIGGSEDLPSPPSDARALHEAIAGSELEIIEGAGHISNLDAADAFTTVLRRFLQHRLTI